MKTLYIVRHAKSSWKDHVSDHQRPLNSRGKDDAVLMSNAIAARFEKPDAMISSDANRALTTAKHIQQAFAFPDELFFTNPELYDFEGKQALEAIKNCEVFTQQTIDTLMIFGHNHALTHLANQLGDQHIDNLPTCGFIKIEFNVDRWQEIKRGMTKALLVPKQLKKED